jgi:hypothetical protein
VRWGFLAMSQFVLGECYVKFLISVVIIFTIEDSFCDQIGSLLLACV